MLQVDDLIEAYQFAKSHVLSLSNILKSHIILRVKEKWLLSELSRNTAVWKIQSEINYWIKREAYYENLNRLDVSYEELDYQESLPFLLMLPISFGISKKFVK